jgi:hypothetical protein
MPVHNANNSGSNLDQGGSARMPKPSEKSFLMPALNSLNSGSNLDQGGSARMPKPLEKLTSVSPQEQTNKRKVPEKRC